MRFGLVIIALFFFLGINLESYASYQHHHHHHKHKHHGGGGGIPNHLRTGEKTIVVSPRSHVWAAYSSNGTLVRSGMASAGADWCPDRHRPCHTRVGVFRIYSLGGPGCKSSIFPLPHGGAPMPYCMFFNKNQALHGAPAGHVVNGNISHGCVRMHVDDARWLRYDFVHIGTKVIIEPY